MTAKRNAPQSARSAKSRARATSRPKAAGVTTPLKASNRPGRSARHDEIVEAAVRVIARDGLARASLRTIAGEIGYTTGVVMHYFKDRNDLLVAAADAVFAPYEKLLAEALVMDDALEGLRRICLIPLPTTPEKELIPRMYAQVLATIDTEPEFAETCRKRYSAIRQGVQRLLAAGQKNGSFRKDFNAAMQCDVLCALIDGLALHAVSEPSRFPAARVVRIVMQELEKLRA
jgi:TetR/AcrR family transcriptional regulator, transcriptional repressor of bet genes